MRARTVGLAVGALTLLLAVILPPPPGLERAGFVTAGLVVLMAAWWMTEALPLTATALMPFLVLPFAGVLDARETASAYYSPILFLILGGAFLALAIERTGMHRRLALGLLRLTGRNGGRGGGQTRVLFAFMAAAAILSMLISNTSTALIMVPMALAVLEAGGSLPDDREGLAGALPMGIAFAATIGGLGTLVGTPTNAIAVGLIDTLTGVRITFAQWALYGLPLVILGVPLAALIVSRVQRVADRPFDVAAARAAIASDTRWTMPEKRLLPVIAITFALWMAQPLLAPLLPEGALTDGTIAVAAGLALFLLPDGTGRPLLTWPEADRAPWGVIMMFGGGLALAAGMSASGLADWLGQALLPLDALPLIVLALLVTALVILITEFASNVATASAIVPVVASLSVALEIDPMLLAMPAAIAATWGFMLPAGTGPNAIAWASGRLTMARMVRAGLILDLAGAVLIVTLIWGISALA